MFTALFLVTLLLPTCFLTVPLSGCGFAWSSDDVLLSGATCLWTTPTIRWRHVFWLIRTLWNAAWRVRPADESGRVYRDSTPDLLLK